jgi:multidrug resistance efflux pump
VSLNADRLAFCEAAAARLGPALEARRREGRSIRLHVREVLQERLALLAGPEHLRAKVVGATLLVLAIALAAAVVAPIDGFIAESRARAGDSVRAGQVLGLLDDTELALEQRKWEGRRAQLARSYRAALASGERSEVSILRAQLDQADAEIGLLTEQIARTRLVAPFDGIVARGDLSRSLGSPVERGEVLFEVAPLDAYRIVVEVDERDIAAVEPAQQGRLTLTALPEAVLGFTVSRVTPIATSAEGGNHFPVEANLGSASVALRPGMEGVAKIEIERRSLLWILSHRVVDWLRFAAWSWLP